MSFWTINAVLGAALYMPRVLPLYGCPPLDFGSKYLLKHCLDQESLLGEYIVLLHSINNVKTTGTEAIL